MRIGKLAISRGHPSSEPPHLALVPARNEPAPEPAPPPHDLVEHRLTSLERLTRLYEQGVLTVDEFIEEKALILGRRAANPVEGAAPVHFVPAAPRAPRRGPSLVGRMLGWRFALLSLVVGIGFSFAIQPDTTSRFFTQLWRALGG
ncbi:MAG: hypothetical protein QOD42_3438 [Sphingomonadales bacterium]|jgi:hypothetical protein|nr:hypothetical protein [Sphingomonadales bacterium]